MFLGRSNYFYHVTLMSPRRAYFLNVRNPICCLKGGLERTGECEGGSEKTGGSEVNFSLITKGDGFLLLLVILFHTLQEVLVATGLPQVLIGANK